MTPEFAEALAARLTVVCVACGESLAGHVDAQGRCRECTGDNIGPCEACGDVEALDDYDRCGSCGHCGECADSLEGTDGPFCSLDCERASLARHRADLQEFDR